MDYRQWLESRAQANQHHGFDPVFMPDFLFAFQRSMVEWAVRKGRAAIFEDCGLGKTPQSLVWAQNVVEHTNRPVLIATPLAVTAQFEREAEKFGISAKRSRDGSISGDIVITNYEQLEKFDANDFAGMVCDESSILKNFAGTRKQQITDMMRKMRYRLLATATAAPNDFIELGTSSEALGYLGYMDMLNKFFTNNMNNSATGRYRGQSIKWRLKGHAERPFWRWVCSWARALRKPSDIGFSDEGYDLPELVEQCHIVESRTTPEGMLFALPAAGLKEQREERRRTIQERCERMAELATTTDYALMWCHLNDEGDLLEQMIPDCAQVSGSDSDEAKEEKLNAFALGEIRALVTKPKIGAWGLNYQHCNHVLTFPSHSFEQYYQSVRRCWRFGQERSVTVDMITTEGEQDVLKNLQRKATQAEEMFTNLVQQMNKELSVINDRQHDQSVEVPAWAA